MESSPISKDISIAASQSLDERKYWEKKLSGYRSDSLFSYDKDLNSNHSTFKIMNHPFAPDIFKRLMKISKSSDYKLFMVLAAALVILIYKISEEEDILICSPIYRQKIEADFINTVLLLRNQVNGNMTFKEILLQVKQCIREALANQNYPISTLLYDLVPSLIKNEKIGIDIVILLENIHEAKYLKEVRTNLCFSFNRDQGGLELSLSYNPWCCSAHKAKQMMDHYIILLNRVLSNVDLPLGHFNALNEEEKKWLLYDFNRTQITYSGTKTIHQLFREQAEKNPDCIAIDCAQANTHLTFGGLNMKSNQVARKLGELGITRGSIVAIRVNPSLELAIGLLGILKAGGVYLPLELNSYSQRTSYILKNTAVDTIIYDHGLQDLPVDLPVILHINETSVDMKKGTNVERGVLPTDPAYIIHTSGSTGRPKGVLVEHQSAANTLVCRREMYQMNRQTISLQLFSYEFDGFVTSFFTPLISGARNILLDQVGVREIAVLKSTITRQQVTHFIAIPALYRAIIENLSRKETSSITVVTLAGESLPQDIIRLSQSKNEKIEIVNEYGVTEAAVMSSIFRDQQGDRQIKIGKPTSNTEIFIFNRHRGLLPRGVPGEICIGGIGVARGYLNDPVRTNQRFTINPYKKDQRLFCTGDSGEIMEDGNLRLLGRKDNQVKIRGFRVELEEVEACLRNHPYIKDIVVMTKEDNHLQRYLYAFVVPEISELSNDELSLMVNFRKYLSELLPDYMHPNSFILMDSLPVTTSGKVDRKALERKEVSLTPDAAYLAPRNKREETLVNIWAQYLEVERVGVRDNFFNIGGDSIKTIGLLSTINNEFNINLNIIDLYQNETIEKLGEKIEEAKNSREEENIEVINKIDDLKRKFMETI